MKVSPPRHSASDDAAFWMLKTYMGILRSHCDDDCGLAIGNFTRDRRSASCECPLLAQSGHPLVSPRPIGALLLVVRYLSTLQRRNETARVHHVSRRCGGCLPAYSACAEIAAAHWVACVRRSNIGSNRSVVEGRPRSDRTR